MKEAALAIVKRLREAGHLAFFVGGCVRDLVIGIAPKDYDVATSAHPEQVMGLFPQTIAVGAQFGVVLVVQEGQQIEVATFRSDGVYADGRHPGQVTFTDDPRDDVLRRDFTINGLLCDPITETILDYVEGKKDIQERVIRTIGNVEQRLSEDKLRLMRAVRFASRFNYRLAPETKTAVVKLAGQIKQVSPERIREELVKILTEGYAARGIRLLDEVHLLHHVLPEVSALKGVNQPPEFHPEGDVWVHTLLMLELMDQTRAEKHRGTLNTRETLYPSVTLAMGVLLHDIGKPLTFEIKDRIRFNDHCEVGARMTVAIGDRFRFTNRQTEHMTQLVRHHLKFKDLPQMRASTVKRFLRQEGFEEHLELHRLDCLGSHGNLDNWNYARTLLNRLGPEEIRPQRLLTGDDLVRLGYTPGPLFKEILRSVEDAQLENQVRTAEDAQRLVLTKFPPRPTTS
jgi:poly(A) polymerase